MVWGWLRRLLLSPFKNVYICILWQIDFAIKNLKKKKNFLPSSTIQVQLQFSTRCFLTNLGSQCWKDTEKAADVRLFCSEGWRRGAVAPGSTGQGHTQVSPEPRPHPGLSPFLACILDLRLGLKSQTGALNHHGYSMVSA